MHISIREKVARVLKALGLALSQAHATVIVTIVHRAVANMLENHGPRCIACHKVMLELPNVANETLEIRVPERVHDFARVCVEAHHTNNNSLVLAVGDIAQALELEERAQLGDTVLSTQVLGGQKYEGDAAAAELEDGAGEFVAEAALDLGVVVEHARSVPEGAQALRDAHRQVAYGAVWTRPGNTQVGELLAAVEGEEAGVAHGAATIVTRAGHDGVQGRYAQQARKERGRARQARAVSGTEGGQKHC